MDSIKPATFAYHIRGAQLQHLISSAEATALAVMADKCGTAHARILLAGLRERQYLIRQLQAPVTDESRQLRHETT
jgi:hypothetical protein